MNQDLWTNVDRYLTDLVVQPDATLDAALAASTAADLPAISVSAPLGKFLHLLAKIQGARTILEIGTLAGYSTIWLARALPKDGRLITLEVDPKHAEVARANLAAAGVSDLVELRLGPALETLPALGRELKGPFDFIFIDADKQSIPEYFTWALRLSRQGSLIVIDNVVRKGAILDAASEDASVRGVQRFNEMLAREPRVAATTIQTVGSKGYDGFTLIRVN